MPLEKTGLRLQGFTLRDGGRISEKAGSFRRREALPPYLEPERKSLYATIAINAIIDCMASITIRRLPENTKRRLRIRAARNGRSMEQEARELLEAALARTEPKSENLGEIIHRRFAALGGVDLKIPPRGPIRDPGIR